MKYCSKCVVPETVDTITFDDKGVCSVCRQIEFKNEKIDWYARRKELDELVSEYRGKGIYDCIVPFSGGKDSVFQAWYIVNELKMKPLIVRFNHWGYRPLTFENNTKVLKQLNVDFLEFTPRWQIIRELMQESFKRRGDFCWHCHTGIYGGVMQIAVKFGVPLIFWGESVAEYHSWYTYEEKEELDEKRFNRCANLGMTSDDMFEFLKGRVDKRDLWMFTFPPRKDLMRMKCRSVCLGSYISWDIKKHVEIIKKELGWKGQDVEGVPPEYDYEKIECYFQGMRDYSKFVKRGYARTNHLTSIDIRNGRMTRDEAWVLTQKYDGKRPATMDNFLKILQITEDEFYEILSQHKVFPWEFNRKEVENGEPLHDNAQMDITAVDQSIGEKGKLEKYL